MHIVDKGSGPALLLIPGIQGHWEYVGPAVEALSAAFRVITFPLADEPRAGCRFDRTLGFESYVQQVEGALVETFPNPIVSNARWTAAGLPPARASISLVPPPAGIRPTPASTRPM